MPYIYQAEMLCDDCGRAIINDLPDQDDTGDTDDYPQHASEDESVDYPQHCGHCHTPLGNPLTSEGVDYVIESLIDDLMDNTPDGRNKIVPDDDRLIYYRGSRRCEILRDWAELADSHMLNTAQKFVVNHYLETTQP